MTAYLANEMGPVSLVLDLLIAHERFGSRSDPSLNGHLHYPNDIGRSLNETVTDKIRKYHTDYNNNTPNGISFMPAITGTGRLHSEFVRLLFLQAHRETDRFFAASGVQLAQCNSGLHTNVLFRNGPSTTSKNPLNCTNFTTSRKKSFMSAKNQEGANEGYYNVSQYITGFGLHAT